MESVTAGVRARLADLVGEEPSPAETALLGRLLRSFRERAPASADLLCDLLCEGDPGRVRDQAHALRGSAANIGATALAELCGGVEDQAGAGVVADPATTAARIRLELAAAVRAVAEVAHDYQQQ